MYKFKNTELANQCFSHPSASINLSFQRLEFLGDKILGFILSCILFEKYPKLKEGELTIILSSLVNQKKLYEKANFLRKHLNISCPVNYSSLSDCFEAWVAAVYLDGGNIHEILLKIFQTELNSDILASASYKNQLQEITQKYQIVPEYIYEQRGDRFVCTLYINKTKSFGVGCSKKDSSQKAAKSWIKKFSQTNFFEEESK